MTRFSPAAVAKKILQVCRLEGVWPAYRGVTDLDRGFGARVHLVHILN